MSAGDFLSWLLAGFLGSWALLILFFYALMEHRKERFRYAISIAVVAIGVAGFAYYFVSGSGEHSVPEPTVLQHVAVAVGWLMPCVLHALCGREAGLAAWRMIATLFSGSWRWLRRILKF